MSLPRLLLLILPGSAPGPKEGKVRVRWVRTSCVISLDNNTWWDIMAMTSNTWQLCYQYLLEAGDQWMPSAFLLIVWAWNAKFTSMTLKPKLFINLAEINPKNIILKDYNVIWSLYLPERLFASTTENLVLWFWNSKPGTDIPLEFVTRATKFKINYWIFLF